MVKRKEMNVEVIFAKESEESHKALKEVIKLMKNIRENSKPSK